MIADKECMRFDCLPGGLWEGIIARLGPTDLSNLATVGNRELHQLASSDFIWSQVYQVGRQTQHWPRPGVFPIYHACLQPHASQLASLQPKTPSRPSCVLVQRDWGVDGEAHAAQAAASVLGSPPRPLSAAAGPSAALLEMVSPADFAC